MWALATTTTELATNAEGLWTTLAQVIAALLIALAVERNLPDLVMDRKAFEDYLSWNADLVAAHRDKDEERLKGLRESFPKSVDPARALGRLRREHAKRWQSMMATTVAAAIGLGTALLMLTPIGGPEEAAWLALLVCAGAVTWMLAAIVSNVRSLSPSRLSLRTPMNAPRMSWS